MTWVVVPAAGRGARYGAGIPKQYLDVDGEPLIAHAHATSCGCSGWNARNREGRKG